MNTIWILLTVGYMYGGSGTVNGIEFESEKACEVAKQYIETVDVTGSSFEVVCVRKNL